MQPNFKGLLQLVPIATFLMVLWLLTDRGHEWRLKRIQESLDNLSCYSYVHVEEYSDGAVNTWDSQKFPLVDDALKEAEDIEKELEEMYLDSFKIHILEACDGR